MRLANPLVESQKNRTPVLKSGRVFYFEKERDRDFRHRMNSDELTRYIEATDGITKPWLLVLLRLKKLEEQRPTMDEETYMADVAELHQTLMGLGEWWVGIEDEVF